MKLYSNSIVSMPISGCKDCPNRTHQSVKVADRFRTEYFCKLIFTTWENPINSLRHRTFASVAEPMQIGGTLSGCPLPDHITTQQGD